ncbi:hypothetical protein FHR70_001801 [Microvirga lupini]|uniref:Uncharacterized protein n=1 Tax=Microvirga lupini TaxID=420324 RepID=A0A7W4VK93_9HYPH|nr:hypothetical protein [Microvirga lupini]
MLVLHQCATHPGLLGRLSPVRVLCMLPAAFHYTIMDTAGIVCWTLAAREHAILSRSNHVHSVRRNRL